MPLSGKTNLENEIEEGFIKFLLYIVLIIWVNIGALITGSMGYQSLMILKGVVEGVWLVIMRGVGKALQTFIEKGPIENKKIEYN